MTKIITQNGIHEITHTLLFKINDKIDFNKYHKVTSEDILKSKEIREFLILALRQRIDSCTSQLFRNYNNVVSVSEYQIKFAIKSANKIHEYNIPSVEIMNDMIKWLEFYNNEGTSNSPHGGWEQLGKSLVFAEKPEHEFTIKILEKEVKISLGDIVSLIWECHNFQIYSNK